MSEEVEQNSVTCWIDDARVGDEQARFKLWAAYFERLIRFSKSRMDDKIRRVQDEEDVVAHAFQSLFEMIQSEGFKGDANRDDLWRLLIRIAENKIIDLAKHANAQKRGGGKVRGHSVLLGHGEIGNADFGDIPDPTPEFADEFGLTVAESLAALTPDQREIAQMKIVGFTNLEIANQLGKSEESVRRKLCLIRDKWSLE